mgnify:CR=1 FL=1
MAFSPRHKPPPRWGRRHASSDRQDSIVRAPAASRQAGFAAGGQRRRLDNLNLLTMKWHPRSLPCTRLRVSALSISLLFSCTWTTTCQQRLSFIITQTRLKYDTAHESHPRPNPSINRRSIIDPRHQRDACRSILLRRSATRRAGMFKTLRESLNIRRLTQNDARKTTGIRQHTSWAWRIFIVYPLNPVVFSTLRTGLRCVHYTVTRCRAAHSALTLVAPLSGCAREPIASECAKARMAKALSSAKRSSSFCPFGRRDVFGEFVTLLRELRRFSKGQRQYPFRSQVRKRLANLTRSAREW